MEPSTDTMISFSVCCHHLKKKDLAVFSGILLRINRHPGNLVWIFVRFMKKHYDAEAST
jgi:hypothetical protein